MPQNTFPELWPPFFFCCSLAKTKNYLYNTYVYLKVGPNQRHVRLRFGIVNKFLISCCSVFLSVFLFLFFFFFFLAWSHRTNVFVRGGSQSHFGSLCEYLWDTFAVWSLLMMCCPLDHHGNDRQEPNQLTSGPRYFCIFLYRSSLLAVFWFAECHFDGSCELALLMIPKKKNPISTSNCTVC